MVEVSKNTRYFGTNGIRGIPNRDLTMDFCLQMGKAIGTFHNTGIVAMARDTRISGNAVFSAVSSGILSTGMNIEDLGILPTPALQYYCKTFSVPGVMITASHNPPEFNGIKCIAKDGTELHWTDEERIEKIYEGGSFKSVDWRNIGTIRSVNTAVSLYVNGITEHVRADLIRKKKFRVLFDAGSGASFETTPKLLESLGCSMVTLNCFPDGTFSGRHSEPKEENLHDMQNIMKNGSFDLGIAHDGDADRVVFFDENGNFIDGDQSFSLIVKSTVKEGDVVVTPVSSSDSMDEICREKGASLIRTKVGAPIVSRTMIEKKAKIGGEENGGVIYGEHQFCRDGAMTAALFLNLLAQGDEKASDLIKELPKYRIFRISVPISRPWKDISKKFSETVEGKRIDRTDGLKIYEDDSWVLVRPSGTEPIVRIFGESSSLDSARSIAVRYREIIENLLK